MREAGNIAKYDINAIMKTLKNENDKFTLFGGEPLLMKLEDLETLWKYGFDKYGKNQVQTNGTILSTKHLDLMKKYNVGIGISIDGPGVCNKARCDEDTTNKILENIYILIAEGIIPSFIITINKYNVENSTILIKWLKRMDKAGVFSIRLHLLERDNKDEYVDPIPLLKEIACTSWDRIKFDLFEEIKYLLRAEESKASCTFRGCDPLNTQAVRGIDGNGTLSNCGRVNKNGVSYRKSDFHGNERTIILSQTPQEHGGCKDCEYLRVCNGYCPGTAIDGDWRNRSEHCDTLKWLFSYFRKDVGYKIPLGQVRVGRNIPR